jgi:hypothetical protein
MAKDSGAEDCVWLSSIGCGVLTMKNSSAGPHKDDHSERNSSCGEEHLHRLEPPLGPSMSLWQKLTSAVTTLGDVQPHHSPHLTPLSPSAASSSPSGAYGQGGPGVFFGKELNHRNTSRPVHRKLWSVSATLEMKCLWDEFNELGTEMIVTKAGR